MSISDKDIEFMEKVAAYYRSTKTQQEPCGSLRDTALKFGINRNKVRKILITMGELELPFTEDAVFMREQGMSIKEIARNLGVSVATVSMSLPYEDKIDNSLDPTAHASDVRGYRAYQREQQERQRKRSSDKAVIPAVSNPDNNDGPSVFRKEWLEDMKMSYNEAYHRPHRDTWDELDEVKVSLKEELLREVPEEFNELQAIMKKREQERKAAETELSKLMAKKKLSKAEKTRILKLQIITGKFPGALNDRNKEDLERIAGGLLPPEPREVMRLHLELYDEHLTDEDLETLKRYGNLKYGNCISRDIIVPKDMPLYALHYSIQRAFGWENSHRHMFKLPEDVFDAVTNNNTSMWSCLVGVLFRSPVMSDEDEFWADDYTGGSLKNWFRKKYTGPYISQCHGEGILSCQEEMAMLDMDKECYVLYATGFNPETQAYDEEEHISRVTTVYDRNGNRREEPKPWYKDEIPTRVEIVKLEDLPPKGLLHLFEKDPMALLERLSISSVLAASRMGLSEHCSVEERVYLDSQISKNGREVFEPLKEFIQRIISEQIDSPLVQVQPSPVTDTILYTYNFMNRWKIKITASENCKDLVESGRITQAELDKANVKCREVCRPVLITRDGEILFDGDVGLHGFAEFLSMIHPDLGSMSSDEQRRAKREGRKAEELARRLGWKRENVTCFNVL